MPHCPIIPIVRDDLANKRAFNLYQDCLPYSSLLFIDADSGNCENAVLKLIMEDRPITVLYSTKDIGWQRVAHVVRPGAVCSVEDTRHLREYAGSYRIFASLRERLTAISHIPL